MKITEGKTLIYALICQGYNQLIPQNNFGHFVVFRSFLISCHHYLVHTHFYIVRMEDMCRIRISGVVLVYFLGRRFIFVSDCTSLVQTMKFVTSHFIHKDDN